MSDLICKCGHRYAKHRKSIIGNVRLFCFVPGSAYLGRFADDCNDFQADNLNYLKAKYEEIKKGD